MLNLVLSDVERMLDAQHLLNNPYEDEWLEDPVVQEMILDVDKSKVISSHVIESPVLGPIAPDELLAA